MKYTSALNLLVMTVLMLGGLMGSPVMADTSFDDIIVGSGAGGGPHVRVFDASTDTVEGESEQAEDLVEEGSSDDAEQSSSRTDPEWRYVPVRRVADL